MNNKLELIVTDKSKKKKLVSVESTGVSDSFAKGFAYSFVSNNLKADKIEVKKHGLPL